VEKAVFSQDQKHLMRFTFLLVLTCLSLVCYSQEQRKFKIKQGGWIGELSLNEDDVLPFNLVIDKVGKSYSFTVENGDEMIKMNNPEVINDSVHVRFPFFNSELVFAVKSKKSVQGYWVNYNKGPHYKIPFNSFRKRKAARFVTATKKVEDTLAQQISGKWAVTFEPGTDGAYPAVGIFEQEGKNNNITGTFLTETGDYRFLAGNYVDDQLKLSCFDGSHAFLFTADMINDSLFGKFFSGNHWQSAWQGTKDANATLKSPEELTYIVDEQEVAFELKDLSGNTFSFPNEKFDQKVTIIQIMGTWCPNCLDETKFYKDLYAKYHAQGLEIISVGYEIGDSFDQHAAAVKRLQEKLDLDFTFLVGGKASKGKASEDFEMLNKIISFPTSIYIGRDGMVKRVHTGFNGPGTGDYYKEYVENTVSLIEQLLAD